MSRDIDLEGLERRLTNKMFIIIIIIIRKNSVLPALDPRMSDTLISKVHQELCHPTPFSISEVNLSGFPKGFSIV